MNHAPKNGPDGTYKCFSCDARTGIGWEDTPEGSWLTWDCKTCGEKGRQFHYYEEFEHPPETLRRMQ